MRLINKLEGEEKKEKSSPWVDEKGKMGFGLWCACPDHVFPDRDASAHYLIPIQPIISYPSSSLSRFIISVGYFLTFYENRMRRTCKKISESAKDGMKTGVATID